MGPTAALVGLAAALDTGEVADQEHAAVGLFHELPESGHGDVDQLALVAVVVAGYQDREVVDKEPVAFLSHDHEAELVQEFHRVNGPEARVEDHSAGADGVVEGPPEIFSGDAVVDVERPVCLHGHEPEGAPLKGLLEGHIADLLALLDEVLGYFTAEG